MLSLIYPTLFAAGSSLFARLLFPTTAVSQFLSLTQRSFLTSERLLLASVDDFFLPSPSSSYTKAQIKTLRAELVLQTVALPGAYDSTVFEISFNQFSPYRLYPFLGHVRKLKMDLGSYSPSPASPLVVPQLRSEPPQAASSRATLVSHPSRSRTSSSGKATGKESTRSAFEGPTREFVASLVDAFGVVHQVLSDSSSERTSDVERRGIVGLRERLMDAEETFGREMDERLESAVRKWEKQEGSGRKVDGELLQIGLFSYSIREVTDSRPPSHRYKNRLMSFCFRSFQIARTLDAALGSAQELSTHTSPKPTLRLPQIGRRWLNKSSVSAEWTEAGERQEQEEGEFRLVPFVLSSPSR